ncbi:hypothetical protein ATCC90586_002870 [Pythium insidiosum]|nr:hypothetical protein ATCC90586_002870 [Pythium insidiosum]
MGIDSQRIVWRDRERASVLKVQRVFRRMRNRTLEMDAAARRIQAFARRYVLSTRSTAVSAASAAPAPGAKPSRRAPRRHSRRQQDEPGDDEEKPAFGDMTRTTATTAPLTTSTLGSRRRTMLERFDEEDGEDDDDDDVADAYARRRSSEAPPRRHQPQRPQQEEQQQQFEVLLWHGVHLGLGLASCPFTGYPVVREIAGANDALPGMWHVQVGDDLMAINDESAHGSTMPFEEVLQILESGVRPALLRFRRPRLQVKLARAQAAQRRRGSSPSPSRHRAASLRRSSPQATSPLLGAITETTRGRRTELSAARSITSPSRRDPIRHRQRTEASLCYLIWREEDGKLGLKFVQHTNQPYPEVSEVKSYGVAARERISPAVCVGDLLLSINQVDVSSLGFKRVLQVLHSNGLPSPSALKSPTAGPHKAFPSLAIPSPDEEDLASEKFQQPATPQPALSRRARHARSSNSARDIARKFDSQRSLALAPSSDVDEDPVGPTDPSNQEEADDKAAEARAAASIEDVHVSTPMKRRIMSPQPSQALSKADEESESSPLKRLNVAHQQLHQHHRRVSTDTALFSKLLKKKPDEHINTEVVSYFDRLTVRTVSRPDQKQNNQLEEDEVARGAVTPFDVTEIVSAFKRGETIPVAQALDIVQRATNAMNLEPNVVSMKAPITIVGDLHGQFSDLIEIFRVHGTPSPKNPFLFLGDYVDRGVSSCEIILSLLSFKVAHPGSVFLLRGNHECRSLSTFYGFRAECLKKYGPVVYNRTIKCFESMPLAARLTTSYGTFLAVHGGLSPNIQYVEEINDKVNRFVEPEPSGALCDLLWSDPAKETQKQSEPWAHNGVRGCSFTFNEDVCREFLERNGLLAIIRAHELEADGYREHFLDKTRRGRAANDGVSAAFPPVITVFSAPDDSAALLDYRQHGRSAQREFEFGGPSEADAISVFLRDQLPFLPVDFYELWSALRLYFAILDVSGSGVLLEESFVILLAEQDGDAYATQEELELLMDVFDCNGDGLITTQDFLQFAYRALLHWTKRVAPLPSVASASK